MRKNIDMFYLIFILLGIITILFILLPPLKTILYTPLSILWNTILDPEVNYSIYLTVTAALTATTIGFLLGVPLAYLLARHHFLGKKILEAMIDIPIVIPHSAAGVALLFVFGRNYFLGRVFKIIGIDFFQTFAGIVLAMMFVSVPFLIDSAKEGFIAINTELEEIAYTYGASHWQVFWYISLPLALKSIYSGSILMWGRGVSEFGAVMIIAYNASFLGKSGKALPVLVSDRFNFGLSYARPIAALGVLISLIIFIILRILITRNKNN
ncbi:MAG: ABC transporter permease [Atribacterota bacterium]|nr:ABC transporter permease [Atribacterota bacterium]MDD4895360.1 ABC transporter permease [Atribacterota bacterium]MDD5637110.1 ABC transporter permease [Atribacterota bacterium]